MRNEWRTPDLYEVRSYPLHRPAKRVVRNHRKEVGALNRRLLAVGHEMGRWSYRSGLSFAKCERCGRTYRLHLGQSETVVAPCRGVEGSHS